MTISFTSKKLVINETVKLAGRTLADIEKDMFANGLRDQSGNRQYAVTQGNIATNLDFKRSYAQIRLIKPPKSIVWGAKLRIGLHRVAVTLTGETRICGLKSPSSLTKPAKAEWKRFRGELERHERKHYADSQTAAKTYVKGLGKLVVSVKLKYFDPSLRECDETAKKAAVPLLEKEILNLAKWTRHVDSITGLLFDLSTGHGASSGAKLNTKIV